MRLVIVGNGVIALTIAHALLHVENTPIKNIAIIGPNAREGSATLAAAAMLNSFAELETGSLNHQVDKDKFSLSREATSLWPDFVRNLADEAGMPEFGIGLGTFVINNAGADDLDDANFNAIVGYLKEFGEPFDVANPFDIPNYAPNPRLRALRSIYIPREGWLNPRLLMAALESALSKSGKVQFLNGEARSVRMSAGRVSEIHWSNGDPVEGDVFLLANGANMTQLLDASHLGLSIQKMVYGVGATVEIGSQEHVHTHCVRTPNRGLACGVYSAPYTSSSTLVGASNFLTTKPESDARVGSVYSLLKSAMEQLNVNFYRANVLRINTGWRPTTEDTYPLLGRTSIPNLMIAGGTKRDGLHLSPVIASYMANLIAHNRDDERFTAFVPERAPLRTLSREQAVTKAVRHLVSANYQHDYQPAKNRMTEQLEAMYRNEVEMVHDMVGANDWGLPVELIDLYRHGYLGART